MAQRQGMTTESAFSGGILMALLWGIGVSLRGFLLGAHDISWGAWMAELSIGVLVCLVVPPALVLGVNWINSHFDHRQLS